MGTKAFICLHFLRVTTPAMHIAWSLQCRTLAPQGLSIREDPKVVGDLRDVSFFLVEVLKEIDFTTAHMFSFVPVREKQMERDDRRFEGVAALRASV